MKFVGFLDRHAGFAIRLLCLVLIGVPALLVLAQALDFMTWKREEAAALVQAVGSVLGLGIAIWIPYRMRELDRARADHAELVEQVRVGWLAECSVHEASAAVFGLIDQLDANPTMLQGALGTARLEQAGHTLRALISEQLPYRMVNWVFLAIAEVAQTLDDASEWGCFKPDNWEQILRNHASTLGAIRLMIHDEHKRMADSGGIPANVRVVQ